MAINRLFSSLHQLLNNRSRLHKPMYRMWHLLHLNALEPSLTGQDLYRLDRPQVQLQQQGLANFSVTAQGTFIRCVVAVSIKIRLFYTLSK